MPSTCSDDDDDDDDEDEDGPRRSRTCVAAWSALDTADRSQVVANAAALASCSTACVCSPNHQINKNGAQMCPDFCLYS